VVGAFSTTNSPFVQQLFYYDGNTFTNIGGPATNLAGPPSVYGMNNYGQVVGTAFDTNSTPPIRIAGLFDRTNGLQNLNTMIGASSGWGLGPPTAINNPGQIIGIGVSNGVTRGYLLTPALICDPSSFKYRHGTVTFSISGLNGVTVIIQASCDLLSWDPVATNVIVLNRTTFTDNVTTSCSSHYYRALVVE
jgi:hypothetical protein